MTALIVLKNIGKTFLTEEIETRALNGINLTINKGEYLSLSGQSGCGKSTLLGLLGLLDSPSVGTYQLADKDVSVLLANANKDSEIMKGQGDGERNKIFAEAFGRDPEFFAFYRAMQAYETALIGGDTSLILSPDSEFFKFFGNIKPKSD